MSEKCNEHLQLKFDNGDKVHYYCELETGHSGLHICYGDNYSIEWLPPEDFIDVSKITDEIRESCKQRIKKCRLTGELVKGLDI